jgi:N-acetylglutamate synthase
MDYTIKPMSGTDYAEAMALWKKTEGVGLNESDSEPAIVRYLERNPGLSLVARDADGKMAGAILAGHDGRRGYLYHLAVEPAHRRQGVGITLVERCLAALKAIGIPRCNIIVYADNEEGKKFWRRHGWEERHEMRLMQKQTGGNRVR